MSNSGIGMDDKLMTDTFRFDTQVAVITGAGNGLGKAYAIALAERGACVVVNDLGGAVDGSGGDISPAVAVADQIRSSGGQAVSDGNSVRTPEGGEAIIQTALDSFGRVDIVINNAGILRDKSFQDMQSDLVDSVLDVHLRGAFNVTRPAWRVFRDQGYGRVVNTSSNAGILGNFGQSNYGAAKMGLVGLTRVLAKEGAKYDIKVNAVAPIARTRMTEQLMGDLAKRFDPEPVASVVAYLAHRDVQISGEVLTVAAGRVARFFVGLTRGHYSTDLTVEEVADHLGEIFDEAGYTVPAEPNDELKALLKTMANGRP